MRLCPNQKQILLVDGAYISESEDEMPPLEDDTENKDANVVDAWPELNMPCIRSSAMTRSLLKRDSGVAFFKLHVPSREKCAN